MEICFFCYELAEGVAREGWNTAVGGKMHEALEDSGRPSVGGKPVIDSRNETAEPFNLRRMSNHPNPERRVGLIVVKLENLAAKTRHIDITWAFATARLAGETRS